VFAFSNLAALINYAATFAVAFVLSLYLQYILGYDSRYAGVILVCQPLVQAILSPHAGMLSDRIEARVVASGGMAITAVGLLMLSFLGKETGLPYIVASLVVIGIGLALFSSPNTNAVMSSVDRRYYGVASGMVGTMRSIGMMISMAIIMVVISMIMGRVQIEPGNYDLFIRCIKVIFSIMTAISIIGVLASLARGRRIATG
jgi:MFS family permease